MGTFVLRSKKDADRIKDGVAFFQAVKSRINKFNSNGVKSDFEIETAIKQIVDEALSSDGVIDIFEAAGIKAPSVGILSDEFLLEVKNMQQKNLAFELLKKLLKWLIYVQLCQMYIKDREIFDNTVNCIDWRVLLELDKKGN